MRKHSARAPAGANAAGKEVRALVAEVGPKAAARVLGVSPGYAARVARASANGTMGAVFKSSKAVDKWAGRIDNVAQHAHKVIKEVLKGERAPEQHERAKTKEGRQRQTEAGIIHVQYSDKDIAKKAGISYQKAAAIRQQLERGKEPAPADREKFDKAVQQLLNEKGMLDGINIISKEKAERVLSKMTTEEQAQHSAKKQFSDWKDAKNWANNVHGAPERMVHAYNSGTNTIPAWNFIIFYEDDDSGEEDEGPAIDEPPEPPPPPPPPPPAPKYQNKHPGFLRDIQLTKERLPDNDAGQFVGERLP